jgi:hypothetical protein
MNEQIDCYWNVCGIWQGLLRDRYVILRHYSDLRVRCHKHDVTPRCKSSYVINAYKSRGENPVLAYVSSVFPHGPIYFRSGWRTLSLSGESLCLPVFKVIWAGFTVSDIAPCLSSCWAAKGIAINRGAIK